MSGGVDSSVAAALLKKRGYDVTGLYLQLFKDAGKEKQVERIVKIIGIPLVIKDVRQEFKKGVINYFISEYKAGRTPNPCVVCNREIKFKFLFNELLKLKADYVTTGHYARKREIKNLKSKIKMYKLYEAKDKTKDQSYFLYTLNQKRLAKILFPLGNYIKKEVKKLAKKLNLPISDGEESQSACFISEKWPDEFLKRNIRMKPGNITDVDENIIGRHQGLPLYTIGQRRNIRIGGTGPYYVAQKDFRKNELMVVKNFNNPLLYKKGLFIKKVNWVANKPKLPIKARVAIRYHHPAVRAIIEPEVQPLLVVRVERGRTSSKDLYRVIFTKPQRAVTPGQSAVFYSEKGEVLGGGIVK